MTATFHIHFERRHVVGSVELVGTLHEYDSFLAMDGYEPSSVGWMLTPRRPLRKRWEDRDAGILITKLWQATRFYGAFQLIAGDDDAYRLAEPDLMTQMRRQPLEQS
ncbi:hypothetical protein [Deinococcus sp.]|uniref:hypothetical protein n=1 Tax=Deinococcus sp. TaxID=47478 RepID=UPI003C7D83F6